VRYYHRSQSTAICRQQSADSSLQTTLYLQTGFPSRAHRVLCGAASERRSSRAALFSARIETSERPFRFDPLGFDTPAATQPALVSPSWRRGATPYGMTPQICHCEYTHGVGRHSVWDDIADPSLRRAQRGSNLLLLRGRLLRHSVPRRDRHHVISRSVLCDEAISCFYGGGCFVTPFLAATGIMSFVVVMPIGHLQEGKDPSSERLGTSLVE